MSGQLVRIGPFKTEGASGWNFTAAVVMLSVALIGFALLIVFVVLRGPLDCSQENTNALTLAELTGFGCGLLAASMFDSALAKAAAILLAGSVAGALGFLATGYVYAPHCGAPNLLRLLGM
jgi:hypothetical protein